MSIFRSFKPRPLPCNATSLTTTFHPRLPIRSTRAHPSTTASSVRHFSPLPESTPEFKTLAAAYKQRQEYLNLLREGRLTGRYDLEKIPWQALWAAAKDAPKDADKYLDETSKGATEDYNVRFMENLVQTAAMEEAKAYAAWEGAKENWTTHERAFYYGQRLRSAAKYLAGSLLTTVALVGYLAYQLGQATTTSRQPSTAEVEATRSPDAYNEKSNRPEVQE